MPALLEDTPRVQERPHPLSHDCSHEHSLDHWFEVYWLVEEDYRFSGDNERAIAPDNLHGKRPAGATSLLVYPAQGTGRDRSAKERPHRGKLDRGSVKVKML